MSTDQQIVIPNQSFLAKKGRVGRVVIYRTGPVYVCDTERVMRTIKEDLVWPYEWDNPFEFEIALDKWIGRYNSDFPHQTLDNKTPNQFYREWMKQNAAKFTAPESDNGQSEAEDSLNLA